MDQVCQENRAKIGELRTALGNLNVHEQLYCSDACLMRYLTARRWNVKKAERMLKETLEWRASFKPEDIRWEDVSLEAETGKMYIANVVDKKSRPVIRMVPGKENTSSRVGQMRYLVHTLESAAVYLPPDQEQFVIIIDFKDWSVFKATPIGTVQETAHVLQNHYPERNGVAILLNPPKVFEYFWKLWRPFIDPDTYQKTKFVFTDNENSLKQMEDIFEKQAFTPIFEAQYNHLEYSHKMQENDARKASYWKSAYTG